MAEILVIVNIGNEKGGTIYEISHDNDQVVSCSAIPVLWCAAAHYRFGNRIDCIIEKPHLSLIHRTVVAAQFDYRAGSRTSIVIHIVKHIIESIASANPIRRKAHAGIAHLEPDVKNSDIGLPSVQFRSQDGP
ncbi:MAG: hypothetical protein K0S39_6227 [Paenibacillus sp.]|jgi:hypothetical protein|nr:hypothetical protein [Paenibacillus sp.]